MLSPLFRSWTKATTTLSLATALCAQAPSYSPQGLANVGPVNAETGYPLWYQDRSGLVLEVCTDPAMCFFAAPNPDAPIHFPANRAEALAGAFNYPDESFFYSLGGLMNDPITGNAALYDTALECAFGTGPVMPGDQMVFSRIRIRIDGLTPGVTYTIRHPYHPGEQMVPEGAVGDPRVINMTRDIGTVVGDFRAALKGDIGPFVVPVGFQVASALPGDFISDPATEVAIQPGPSGFDCFEIEGPGAEAAFPSYVVSTTDGRDLVRLSTFSIQGRVARVKGVEVSKAYYSRSLAGANTDVTPQWATSVNLWARSASGQHLFANVGSNPEVGLVELGTSGNYFVRLELGDMAPGFGLTVKNRSDATVSQVDLAQVPDLVIVEKAEVTLGGQFRLFARSSDEDSSGSMANLTGSVLSATGDTQTTVTLQRDPSGENGLYCQPLNTTLGSASTTPTSPRVVEVTSQRGGSAQAPVLVRGFGTVATVVTPPPPPPPTPVTVTAQASSYTVNTSTPTQTNVVTLTAIASANVLAENAFGTNSGYIWSYQAYANDPNTPLPLTINLSNIYVAQPTFAVPLSLPSSFQGTAHVRFSVTVFGPVGTAPATNTTEVTISQPAVMPQDVLAVTDARYETAKLAWRASGTATVLANQTVRIYYVPNLAPSTPVLLGSAVVDAAGLWQYQGGNGSADTAAKRPANANSGTVLVISGFNNPNFTRNLNVDATATYRFK